MAIETLDDLFSDGLRDIYYAEKQILKAIGQMTKKTKSESLRDALETHKRETEEQVQRLEQVFELIEEKPRAKKCDAIEGIITEAKKQMEEIDDEMVRNAAIISAAQSVEHYEIGRYGTLVAWAQRLGNDKAAQLLAETLEEEKATDEKLTELAESEINEQAAAADEDDEEMDKDDEEETAAAPSSGGRSSRRRA